MAYYSRRSPDNFNPMYARTVEWLLQRYLETDKEVRTVMVKNTWVKGAENVMKNFLWWRKCLREHPWHPLHKVESEYVLRMFREQLDSGGCDLWLTLRKKDDTAELQKILLKR